MTLLVVTPDFLSHYLPLSAVATEAARRNIDVVVATGPTLAPRVHDDGFRWAELRMSASSNPGVLGDREHADRHLRSFFAATRHGMVATLRNQAEARTHDLLWEPETVARDIVSIVDRERPDAVVVDHLAFAGTLGLRAAGHPFTTFVPGHPCQVPVGDERYGYPTAWPRAIAADPVELEALYTRCEQVTHAFTGRYNAALAKLDASVGPVVDAFAAHGDDVLYNSPAELHDRHRPLPVRHAFLGSCIRPESSDDGVRRWLDGVGDEPFVYVSFGTFLSARDDVLERVVAALRTMDVQVALATGSAAPARLGHVPARWCVGASLPQISLLRRAHAVVTHGGNNTVTEALSAGCPLVVLPFSTDQFTVAADVERAGLAVALDPNRATGTELGEAISASLAPEMGRRAGALADVIGRRPGPQHALDRLLTGGSARVSG